MQFIHHFLQFSGEDLWDQVQRRDDTLPDQLFFRRRCAVQHIVHHLVAAARMAHADPQAIEVFVSQGFNNVARSVMPAMSTAPLETNYPRRKTYFIMYYQYFLRHNFVKRRNGMHRHAALVHKACRLAQETVGGGDGQTAYCGMKSGL